MRMPCDCEIWQVCPKCTTPEGYDRAAAAIEKLYHENNERDARAVEDDLLDLRAAAAQALRALDAVMNVAMRGDAAGSLVHARETLRHALNASATADSAKRVNPVVRRDEE